MWAKLLAVLCFCSFVSVFSEDCLGVADVRDGRFRRKLTGPLTMYYPEDFPRGRIVNVELKTVGYGLVSLMTGDLNNGQLVVDEIMTQNVSAVGYITFPLSVILKDEEKGIAAAFSDPGVAFPVPYRFSSNGAKVLIKRSVEDYAIGSVINFDSQIFAEFPIRVCIDRTITTPPPMQLGCVGTAEDINRDIFIFRLHNVKTIILDKPITASILTSLQVKIELSGSIYLYIAEPVGGDSYRIISATQSPIVGPGIQSVSLSLPVTSPKARILLASPSGNDFPILYSYNTDESVRGYVGYDVAPYNMGKVLHFPSTYLMDLPLKICQ